jgi:hypothetical protein
MFEQYRATISGMGGFSEPTFSIRGPTSGTSRSKGKRQH